MHGNDDRREHSYDYDAPTGEIPARAPGAGDPVEPGVGPAPDPLTSAPSGYEQHAHGTGDARDAQPAQFAAPPAGDPDPHWMAAHEQREQSAAREREAAAERPAHLPGFANDVVDDLRPGAEMPVFADRRRPPETAEHELPSYDTRERPVVGPDGALPVFTDRDRCRSQPSPAEPPEPEAPATTGERVAAQVRTMLRRRPGSPA